MAIFSLDGIQVSAVSACVPARIRDNNDYDYIPAEDRRLLIRTTGIEQVRVAGAATTTTDLCAAAANRLLADDSPHQPDEIDIVILVSQSPDYRLPASSILLQDRLGLGRDVIAFDIGLGCSGYVHGLSVMGGLLRSLGLRKGLLLAGDISTWNCSPRDKSTYPLFGDAGAATIVETSDDALPMWFSLNTDGSGYEAIMVPGGGMRNRLAPDSFNEEEQEPGVVRSPLHLHLDGMAVFSFGITRVPESVRELTEAFSLDLDSIDHFVMHQANRILNETIRKKLNVPAEKVPYSLPHFGNTSSSSIPLTLVANLRDELEEQDQNLLLTGFGVGLSWANVFLPTRGIFCPPLIELDDDNRTV